MGRKARISVNQMCFNHTAAAGGSASGWMTTAASDSSRLLLADSVCGELHVQPPASHAVFRCRPRPAAATRVWVFQQLTIISGFSIFCSSTRDELIFCSCSFAQSSCCLNNQYVSRCRLISFCVLLCISMFFLSCLMLFCQVFFQDN